MHGGHARGDALATGKGQLLQGERPSRALTPFRQPGTSWQLPSRMPPGAYVGTNLPAYLVANFWAVVSQPPATCPAAQAEVLDALRVSGVRLPADADAALGEPQVF